MRNLKKVLALALATVMLLGMMAIASAADYTDEAQIADQYDAAVDVMSAIGVFNGTNGYMNPKGTLTRAEAAKVITYVALTKANADKLGTAEAPFADVAADHWAAGSIAYAKNLGIVSGKGDNKYDPNGTLTGYEFAKMLLVVAGYNASIEGFTGAGWSTNIDAMALSTGLKSGLNIDMGAAILREEAAQMAFNALEVTCVGYTGGTTLETGDTKIVVGGNRYKVDAATANAYKLGENDEYQQLVEKLYPTLKVDESAETAFGYPVKTWALNGKTVGTEANYTVLGSWDGTAAAVTTGALYNIAGAASLNVYENGADVADVTVARGGTAVPFTAYAGSKVEYIQSGAVKELVITKGTLAKVTKVIDATAAADRKVEVATDLTTADYTITTNKYAKGDYVIVYLVDEPATVDTTDFKVGAHEAAETVYGTLTQTVKSATTGMNTKLYVDGAEIPVAGNENYNAKTVATLNKKYTVVLNNGYAVAAIADTVAADLSDYVYVYGGGAVAGEYVGGTSSYEVKVINMDGTKATLKVEAADFDGTPFSWSAPTFSGAGLYKVTDTDVNGKKEFTAMTSLGDADGVAGSAAFAAVQGAITKAATDKSETLGGQKAYYTANTKVLTISTSAAGVTSGAVTAVPSVATYSNTDPAVTYAIYSYNATAKAREIDLIVTTTVGAVPSDDLYYTIGAEVGKVYVAAAEKTYTQYVAYDLATGEKKTVMATAAPGTGFKTLASVNEYGAYTFGTAPAGNDFTKSNALSVYGNIVTVDATIVDADASEAVIVDNTLAGIKTLADLAAKEAAATTATLEYSVMVDGTDNTVVAIVITKYVKA